MSAILLAGILASIGTAIPWQSLIAIGIVIIVPPFKLLCQIIKRHIEKKPNNQNGNIELQEIQSGEEEVIEE